MMRQFEPVLLRCLFVVAVTAAVAVPCAAESDRFVTAATLVVHLRSEVSVTTDDVLLQDIARITYRDKRKADEVGKLILETWTDKGEPLEITASSVRIRLVLQGWSNQQIQVLGPDRTIVTYHEKSQLTDLDVESAALLTLQHVMEISAEDLQVRLVAGFVEALPNHVRVMDGVRAEVLPPLTEGPGQMSLTVRLWKNNELLLTRVARFDVLRRYRVAVARTLLRRDEPIEADDIQFERRFLAARLDEPQENEVINRRPRRDVKAGDAISMSDLGGVTVTQSRPVLVNKRSTVRVIARSGLVQVTLQAAEAMQSGREGDLIQVRNPESKKLIVGRVTASGDVEIRLR